MAFASGLAAQVAFGQETTVGTAVTVDHFFEHDEANMDLAPTWAEGMGLHAGGQVKRASRAVITTRQASGSFKADVTTKKFGLLFRHMLGSPTSTATLISGTAYKQVHTLGNGVGLGLTTQIGVPRTDGVVEPFTYPGTKITDWTLSCAEGQLLKLDLGLDAWDELTTGTTPAGAALAAASYALPAEVFNFTQCVVKIGGTVATTSGVAAITGGTTVQTLLRNFSLKGTTPLATGRFGNSATKREQLQNGYTVPTLSFDSEFMNRSEFYDVYRAQTVVPIQITFTGSALGASFNTVDIVIPATRQKTNKPNGNGQDLTNQPLDIEVYDDAVNNPLQITYISTDTTL
ncbi:MAG: phage tail tube protein [Frankiaceae bacterium]